MNSDKQPMISQQKQPRVISWSRLIPLLLSQLDNDRRTKLKTLYGRFTRMEIEKVAFFQLTRSIIGNDKIIQMAISKLDTPLVTSPHVQAQASPSVPLVPSPHVQAQAGPSVPLIPSPHVQAQAGPSVSLVPPVTSNEKPAKEPCIGQKKPLEAVLGHSSVPQSSNKKQKVSAEGGFSDIEQLNDVTAVSGVDLREEEEKMFSGPKGGSSRVSEASRKVAQEEEERLILEKGPLHKKLAEVMAIHGLKSASQEVLRCLSMCVEERLKGVISNSIRVSKQRADHEEKSRHRIVISSDVRQKIMSLNRKAGEELERKEAAEKIQMVNETNKEDDISKLRTTAANVAARAAVGGADMLSKWQFMAQTRQKQGHIGVAPVSQPSKDVKLISATRSVMQDNGGGEKRAGAAYVAAAKTNTNFGRSQVAQTRVARRSVSTKDVIAVLEREPQMAKSTLMYRLYERVPLSDTSGAQSQK